MITNPLIPQSQQNLNNPVGFLDNLIQTIITLFLIIAVIYFLVQLFFGTYRFISSEGDKNKLETAKQQLTQSFIGLFIAFSVFAILKLIGSIFGIQGLDNLTIPWPSLF